MRELLNGSELKFQQIISDIKGDKIAPVYYLYGGALWYIEQILEAADKFILTEQEKAFNLVKAYGKETSIKAILDFARRYPVMAQRQMMIVKDIQALGDLSPLLEYFEKPVPTTVLILVSSRESFDKRTKVYKALNKSGVVFEAKAPYESEIPQWIEMYVKARGEKIAPSATRLLAEYMGNDLKTIDNALKKLIIAKEESAEITIELVEQITGINREYNVFMLQKAFSLESDDRIIWIADRMGEDIRSNPMPLVIGSLYNYFSKVFALHAYPSKSREAALALGIPPFFLSEYVAACKRYSPKMLQRIFALLLKADLQSKGVEGANLDQADQLKELIGRILITKDKKVAVA